MAEAPLSLQTWWDTATAVTYLRDGALPEHPSNIDWRSLPKAALQVRILNAALQSDKLETIELIVGGEQRKLPMEEKATLAVRFSEYAALGGRIGVRFEVVNTNTGGRFPGVKLLFLAEQIRALPQSVTDKASASASVAAAVDADVDDSVVGPATTQISVVEAAASNGPTPSEQKDAVQPARQPVDPPTGNQAVATNDADVDVDAAIAAMRDVPRTHVIRILRDLHRQNRLRKDMLPHVVRKLVEDPFKDRFGKKAPSRRTKDRAWEYYLEKFLK
jgi:hypothetical protein